MMGFLDKLFGPGWRDTAERLVWTAVALVLGGLVPLLTDLPNWWAAPAAIIANYLLLKVRQKVDAIPSPGAGLPGVPVEPTSLPPHG